MIVTLSILLGAVVLYFLVGIILLLSKVTFNDKQCSSCGSTDLERVHKDNWGKIFLPYLNYAHLWCRRCWKTYYSFGKRSHTKRRKDLE